MKIKRCWFAPKRVCEYTLRNYDHHRWEECLMMHRMGTSGSVPPPHNLLPCLPPKVCQWPQQNRGSHAEAPSHGDRSALSMEVSSRRQGVQQGESANAEPPPFLLRTVKQAAHACYQKGRVTGSSAHQAWHIPKADNPPKRSFTSANAKHLLPAVARSLLSFSNSFTLRSLQSRTVL